MRREVGLKCLIADLKSNQDGVRADASAPDGAADGGRLPGVRQGLSTDGDGGGGHDAPLVRRPRHPRGDPRRIGERKTHVVAFIWDNPFRCITERHGAIGEPRQADGGAVGAERPELHAQEEGARPGGPQAGQATTATSSSSAQT